MTIKPAHIGMIVVVLSLAAFAGSRLSAQARGSKVTKAEFGKLPDGKAVDRFTLTNASGMEVQVLNYGGIVTALIARRLRWRRIA